MGLRGIIFYNQTRLYNSNNRNMLKLKLRFILAGLKVLHQLVDLAEWTCLNYAKIYQIISAAIILLTIDHENAAFYVNLKKKKEQCTLSHLPSARNYIRPATYRPCTIKRWLSSLFWMLCARTSLSPISPLGILSQRLRSGWRTLPMLGFEVRPQRVPKTRGQIRNPQSYHGINVLVPKSYFDLYALFFETSAHCIINRLHKYNFQCQTVTCSPFIIFA